MSKAKLAAVDKRFGVSLTAWNGHPHYKWRVNYPDGDTRRSKGFKKKSGAEGALEFASEKREEISQNGARHKAITDEERRAVIEFRDLVNQLPDSVNQPSLRDAVALFRDHQKLRNKSKTVREIVDRYVLRLQRKKVSDDYLYTISNRLERFVTDYGDWMACDISQDIAEEWLEDLICAPMSFNHFRAALVQCFNCALDIGAVEVNPASKIAKKKRGPLEVGILTVVQAQALLTHASDDILPGLALGLFAGVRRAELCRMDWGELDFEQDHVEVTAANSKTAARRLIPMREPLKNCLFPLRQTSGPIMPTQATWRKDFQAALDAADIKKWPHNALRHSFASYHLAHFQNAQSLALELGHESTRMIFEHYRAIVAPKAGAGFWRSSRC